MRFVFFRLLLKFRTFIVVKHPRLASLDASRIIALQINTPVLLALIARLLRGYFERVQILLGAMRLELLHQLVELVDVVF